MIDYLKNYINTGSFSSKKAASIGGVKSDSLFSVSNPKGSTTTGFTTNSPGFQIPQKTSTLQTPAPDVQAVKAKAPIGSSYVSSAVKPSTANLAKPVSTSSSSMTQVKPPQPQGWQDAYTSTDPSVQQKMAEMSRQAEVVTPTTPKPSAMPYQAPAVQAPTTSQTSVLGQAYLDAIKAQGQASPIEAQLAELQRQAGDVRISEEAGINKNLANPEIPMDVITGRQANIERSAQGRLNALANQQTPLVTQLAMEQARRTAQTNAAKTAYEISLDEQKAQQEASKPISVSAGTTLIDPTTGQTIYQAPFAEKAQPTSVQEYEYAKANGYQGSFADYQTEDANRKASAASSGMLTPAQQQSTINAIAGAWDNEPIVKNYNIVAEGYQFAKNVANKTNPTSADDQGLIYAFAKAMDPNSVVRESEYDTVQKYNQSMIQKGWADAKRLAANVAFLTPEARQNMIATIQQKYAAAEQNYKNVYNKYQQEINDVKTGQVGRGITDYSAAWDHQGSSNVSAGSDWSW